MKGKGRTKSSPYRYDRAAIRACLENEGLAEARLRWPDDVVAPIARALGLTQKYRPSNVWQAEWSAQLGTMPDALLAGRLGIPTGTVNSQRLKLGIPAFETGERKRERREHMKALLAALPDSVIAQRIDVIRRDYKGQGMRNADITAERTRRGIVRYKRTTSVDVAEMRRVCVAALRAAYPGLTLQAIAAVLGVTRERVRQVEADALAEASK